MIDIYLTLLSLGSISFSVDPCAWALLMPGLAMLGLNTT